MSGPPPIIVLHSKYVISMIEEGSCIDNGSIGPFRIENGVKIDSRGY